MCAIFYIYVYKYFYVYKNIVFTLWYEKQLKKLI